jgi:hypothetical protein
MSAENRTSKELLPCPFCGVQAKARKATNADYYWIVGCTSVRCSFRPEFQHSDRAYAVKQWNKRGKV